MPGGGWVYQSDLQFPLIPSQQALTRVQGRKRYPKLLQPPCDPRQVMLEPIGNQDTLSVRCFDEILQCIKLSVMDADRHPFVGVHSTVCQLQQFARQACSIGSSNLAPRGIKDQLLAKLLVGGSLLIAEGDSVLVGDKFGHPDMVLCLHRDGDVFDRLIDSFFGSWGGFVAEHNLAAALVGLEVRVTIGSYEPSQSHTLVQQLELGPQVDQAVAGRGAGQAHDAPDHRAAFHQCSESF
ncbi:hypothetical protein SDC9_136078 [bioreactor metagenome]|uniref:Uncharacterized protein n=1 Tax=bioreactor metagenome TaxID=1076179 RepID=A0A645DHK5_9ZZZZ